MPDLSSLYSPAPYHIIRFGCLPPHPFPPVPPPPLKNYVQLTQPPSQLWHPPRQHHLPILHQWHSLLPRPLPPPILQPPGGPYPRLLRPANRPPHHHGHHLPGRQIFLTAHSNNRTLKSAGRAARAKPVDGASAHSDDLRTERGQSTVGGSGHDADHEGEETSGDEGWEEVVRFRAAVQGDAEVE